jgi:predicted SAM-dependent methyltransferase
LKIEIGGGRNPKEGYKNVDIIEEADYVCNLEHESLPFKDESVKKIYSHHAFEHIENTIFLMNECWRVLKWGGLLHIIVPHKDCTLAWQDPTHKVYWTEENMKFYCGDYLKKYSLDYGIAACFKQIKNKVTAPDNRPEYFKQIEFALVKSKEKFDNFDYDILLDNISDHKRYIRIYGEDLY